MNKSYSIQIESIEEIEYIKNISVYYIKIGYGKERLF